MTADCQRPNYHPDRPHPSDFSAVFDRPVCPVPSLDREYYYHQIADVLNSYITRTQSAARILAQLDETYQPNLIPFITQTPTVSVCKNCVTVQKIASADHERVLEVALEIAHRYKHLAKDGDFDSARKRRYRNKYQSRYFPTVPIAPIKNNAFRLDVSYTGASSDNSSLQVFFWWSTAQPSVWLFADQAQEMTLTETSFVMRHLVYAYAAALRRGLRNITAIGPQPSPQF